MNSNYKQKYKKYIKKISLIGGEFTDGEKIWLEHQFVSKFVNKFPNVYDSVLSQLVNKHGYVNVNNFISELQNKYKTINDDDPIDLESIDLESNELL